MVRALALAANGRGHTSPNPMVGAVIVHKGRIIGEGYHRRYGGPHAEVWAVNSVSERDRPLLQESVMYVTLEPCSHYGKTPPCSRMLVEIGIGGVVVGCLDPNPLVSGRGVKILKDAGIPVTVGVMEQECCELNRRFMTAQVSRRPYVMLKWAMSADGFLAARRDGCIKPVAFSTPLTSQLVHELRSTFDAIMVGSGTVEIDNPLLNVRHIAGRSPRPIVIDRRGTVAANARLFQAPGVIYVSSKLRRDLPAAVERVMVPPECSLGVVLRQLKRLGISSVMVEGGAALLRSFIAGGEWDDARIEQSPVILGDEGYARMELPPGETSFHLTTGPNVIINVKNYK